MNPTKKFVLPVMLIALGLPAFAAEVATPGGAPKAPKAPPLPFSAVPSPARTKDNVEFVIGPDYTAAPEQSAREGVPKGKIYQFTMSSADSKIFTAPTAAPAGAAPAAAPVPYQRQVMVYVPSQYVPGTPAPFIVAQDGARTYGGYLPTMLDNLIHDKRVPAMVAVMINPGAQRSIEYDTVSDAYVNFIETEVLPRITKDYGVTFTKDPEGRATLGGSSGAAAAFTMAWLRPDLYRRVLSYSGTFVNLQKIEIPAYPHGAWEYHERLIAQNERKPLRVWLHVSQNDNGATAPEAGMRNWVIANRRMADALKAKGYPYRYVYAEVAGHTDNRVTRQTLPGALEWLWQGYRAK